jgi:hypothetical protein
MRKTQIRLTKSQKDVSAKQSKNTVERKGKKNTLAKSEMLMSVVFYVCMNVSCIRLDLEWPALQYLSSINQPELTNVE